ncbi:MAG: energy transducer TonB [Flavobacteriales bacterium]|nr:energy transducer TonB [Flavobacteriales bacterium]
MKNILTMALLFAFASAWGQEVIVIKPKQKDKTYLEYQVLKSDKTVKHGYYLHRYNSNWNKDTIEFGYFENGIKHGKWLKKESYKKRILQYYSSGTLDSSKSFSYRYKNEIESAKLEYFSNGEIDSSVNCEMIGSTEKSIYTYYTSGSTPTRKTKTTYPNGLLVKGKNNREDYFMDKRFVGYTIDGKKEGTWVYGDTTKAYKKVHFRNDTMYLSTSHYANGDRRINQRLATKHFREFYLNKSGDTLLFVETMNDSIVGSAWAKHINLPNQLSVSAHFKNGRLMSYYKYDSAGNADSISHVEQGSGQVQGHYPTKKEKLRLWNLITFENGYATNCVYYDSLLNVDSSINIQKGILERYSITSTEDTIPIAEWLFYDNQKMERAEFIGGDYARQKFIQQNIVISDIALSEANSGVIYIDFIIDELGQVTNAEIVKDPVKFGVGESGLSVVKNMSGYWTPATSGEVPIKMRFTIPIRINLD